jgi:RNA polymerase sigma factor (sigma-70 family)
MDVARLFQEHHDALFRYLERYTGDPDLAADAAQEAFVRLARKGPRHDAHVRAWLFQVATNVVRDDRRAGRRRLALLEAKPDRVPGARPEPDPSEQTEREELQLRVRAALDALNQRERTILLMREEGFTHREIAAAVGTTTKSVGTMIARALEKLSRQLGLEPEAVT